MAARRSFLEVISSVRVEEMLPKNVANLWTEFAAQHGEALAANRKEPQNP